MFSSSSDIPDLNERMCTVKRTWLSPSNSQSRANSMMYYKFVFISSSDGAMDGLKSDIENTKEEMEEMHPFLNKPLEKCSKSSLSSFTGNAGNGGNENELLIINQTVVRVVDISRMILLSLQTPFVSSSSTSTSSAISETAENDTMDWLIILPYNIYPIPHLLERHLNSLSVRYPQSCILIRISSQFGSHSQNQNVDKSGLVINRRLISLLKDPKCTCARRLVSEISQIPRSDDDDELTLISELDICVQTCVQNNNYNNDNNQDNNHNNNNHRRQENESNTTNDLNDDGLVKCAHWSVRAYNDPSESIADINNSGGGYELTVPFLMNVKSRVEMYEIDYLSLLRL